MSGVKKHTMNHRLLLMVLCIAAQPAVAMIYPDLRVCNYTRNAVAYRIIGLDTRPIECSPWRRLEADLPFQCETVRLFDGPCQTGVMDSVRVVFNSDRYGACVIPFVKVTSPGKIDVFVERQEGVIKDNKAIRLPTNCRWLYH